MPKIKYITKKFIPSWVEIIDQANEILEEYNAQGIVVTLRQLFYQFVARDLFANTSKNYDRLGNIMTDARLAGLVDWDAIEDRTRNIVKNSHWDNPKSIIDACADSFQLDKWKGQRYMPEVWVEKQALAGVIESVARRLDVTSFACRGYPSASEMWAASQRLIRYCLAGHRPVIIHLGDHDPSGVDMTRDIHDRLKLFMEHHGYEGGPRVDRIALTMAQVEEYSPPPNPARTTDARFAAYQAQFGDESWELDALDPPTLIRLIESAVAGYRDDAKFEKRTRLERKNKRQLAKAAHNWPQLVTEMSAMEDPPEPEEEEETEEPEGTGE
jgi:hypothetical protein